MRLEDMTPFERTIWAAAYGAAFSASVKEMLQVAEVEKSKMIHGGVLTPDQRKELSQIGPADFALEHGNAGWARRVADAAVLKSREP